MKKVRCCFLSTLLASTLHSYANAEDVTLLDPATLAVGTTLGEYLIVKESCPDPARTDCQPTWHRRLLERMSERREDRPAVLSVETTNRLRNYLGFQHLVRNIYAFELDLPRIQQLVADYVAVWHSFDQEVNEFVQWLRFLAEPLEEPE